MKAKAKRKVQKLLQLEYKLLKKLDYVDRNWGNFRLTLKDRMQLKKELDELRQTVQKEIEQFKEILKDLDTNSDKEDLREGIKEADKMYKLLQERMSILKAGIEAIR